MIRRASSLAGWAVLLLASLPLPGCARVSDPLPPLVLIPARTDDLRLTQVGDRILLDFPLPQRNTDGSGTPALAEIALYRLSGGRPPAGAESFREPHAVVWRVNENQLARHRVGDRLRYADDPGRSSSASPFGTAFHYAVEFFNPKGQSDGISNVATLTPVAIPASPGSTRATVLPDRIRLEWDAPGGNMDGSRPPRLAGYNVYRSLESPPRFDRPLNEAPVAVPSFEDRDMVYGRDASYAVTVVGSLQDPPAESPVSNHVTVAPRDVFAPATPARLESFVLDGRIHLRWDVNTEGDLGGYVVYRSQDASARGQRLTGTPIADAGFVDTTATAGRSYYYRVSAVDRLGNESPPTGPVAASLPAPRR